MPKPLSVLVVIGFAALLAARCTGASEPETGAPCDGVTCSGHGSCAEIDGRGLCTCDAGFAPSGSFCEPATETPRILSLRPAEPDEALTEGATLALTLAVTGPAGIDDPIDGVLVSDDGAPLATFELAAPRLYIAHLSWAALHRLRPITFLLGETRTVIARIDDDAGHVDEARLDVALGCGGHGACDGACSEAIDAAHADLDLDASCGLWICGSPTWPVACLERPLAWLWVPEEQLEELLEHEDQDLEVDGVFQLFGRCLPVGVELHGGYALTFDKKSFKVKFNRGDDFPLDPFSSEPGGPELPSDHDFKQLVLKAAAVDPSLLRDRLAEDLTRAVGGLAPRVTFVNLALNGRYQGVYALTEAVTEAFFQRRGLTGEGNLYKAVNHKADFSVKADPLAGYEKKLNEDGPSDDLAALLDAITSTPVTWSAWQEHVAPLIDLELYQRFLAVNVFVNNQDTFTKNYYLYHEAGPPDSRFLIVNWDADATFGRSWDGAPMAAETGTVWGRLNQLTRQLKRIPEGRAAYLELLEDGVEHAFAPEATRALLEASADEIRSDVRFEECRWPDKASTFDAELEIIDAFLKDRGPYLEALIDTEEH